MKSLRLLPFLLLCLAGCQGEEQQGAVSTAPGIATGADVAEPGFAAGERAPAKVGRADAQFAYRHDLGIALLPRWVRPHFLAVREACMSDVELRCDLLEAVSTEIAQGTSFSNAYLRARLPHDKVARYKALVVAPLAGEDRDDVSWVRDRIEVEDLARPIEDLARRQKSVEDYRGRLEVLAGSADKRVEDLIRLATELSDAQSRIETAEQRSMGQKVEAELVTVSFEAERGRGGPFQPLREVAGRSADILGRNAAEALSFVLTIVPWIPVAGGFAGVVHFAWRILRGRRAARPA